jgi:V8-like Glu-specific endopeptidase
MIAKIEEAAKTIGEAGEPEADSRKDVAQVTNTRGAPAVAVAQQRPATPPRASGGGGGTEITGQLRLLNLHTAIIAMRGDPMHVPDGDGGVSIAANSVPSPPYATTAGMA